MDINVSRRDGYLVWELRGDLDFEGARAVRTAARSSEEALGPLVVDLGGVPFADSAGLAALIGLARRVSESGGHVVVSGARRSVRRLLEFTGLNRCLEVAHASDGDLDGPGLGTGSAGPGVVEVSRS